MQSNESLARWNLSRGLRDQRVDLLKKWSDLGSVDAMIKLVEYYCGEGDLDNIIKYYYMALETGNYSMDFLKCYMLSSFSKSEIESLYLKAIKHKIPGAYKSIVEWYSSDAQSDEVSNISNYRDVVIDDDEYLNKIFKYLFIAFNDKSVNTKELESIYLTVCEYLEERFLDFELEECGFLEIRYYCVLKELYQFGVDHNIARAMASMGNYYKDVEKDYNNMKEYYLMAIEKNDDNAMYELGTYYKDVEKDYNNMKKYYLMAIEKNYDHAMYDLGTYYKDVEKDYDNMKKYYLMLIEHFKYSDSREDSLKILLEHYKQNNDKESYELIEKLSKQELYRNHEIIQYYKMTKDYKRIFAEKCFRCLDKYIESSKKINCIHKDICNECTKNRDECPKCGTKYC